MLIGGRLTLAIPEPFLRLLLAGVLSHARDQAARCSRGPLAACAEAEQALEEAQEDDTHAPRTAAVVSLIRELSEGGDDEAHNVAEAFARDDLA